MSRQGSSPPPPKRRFSGPFIVFGGIAIVLLITAFVVVRIIQTSGPGPDPSTIPPRPTAAP
jgi:hypothetical protein